MLIRKVESFEDNDLSFSCNMLGNEKQMKPKVSRKKNKGQSRNQ